jgi:hypothetical protein
MTTLEPDRLKIGRSTGYSTIFGMPLSMMISGSKTVRSRRDRPSASPVAPPTAVPITNAMSTDCAVTLRSNRYAGSERFANSTVSVWTGEGITNVRPDSTSHAMSTSTANAEAPKS